MPTRRRSKIFKDRFVATVETDAPVPQPVKQSRAAARTERHRRAAQAKKRQQKRDRQASNARVKNLVRVQPDHAGKTAVVMASGPGLTKEVTEQIRPYHADGSVVVCGLNDVYRRVDYLDEFYACDRHWWEYHIDHPQDGRPIMETLQNEGARMWGNNTAASLLNDYPHINIVTGEGQKGFQTDPQKGINWGGNSGFQLLNICYQLGFDRMLLVGYNMGIPPKAGKKGHHFFGAHPKPMSQAGSYRGFVKQFKTIQAPIKEKIVNCTPDSFLDCFEWNELQPELDRARDSAQVSK